MCRAREDRRTAVRHTPGGAQVAFTGSTDGRQVDHGGLRRPVKRVSLELGGKSANIVFADADLEKAVASRRCGLRQRRRVCCARRRMLVQESIYDRFLALVEPAVKAIREDPLVDAAEMGPLISAPIATVASYVAGADVAFTGTRRPATGGGSRPLSCSPARPATRTGARRSSGRCCRSCRSVTRPRRSSWPTTPSTGSPARCGPATLAGRCACPGPWRPATSASTRTRRCATGRRSVA